MLTLKEVNKVRTMYYEQNYTATEIARIMKISSSKNKEKIINTNTQQTNQQMITPLKKECCPRCGGKLVKRHGPYGDFYGCENYSKSNCRYTRKFL